MYLDYADYVFKLCWSYIEIMLVIYWNYADHVFKLFWSCIEIMLIMYLHKFDHFDKFRAYLVYYRKKSFF